MQVEIDDVIPFSAQRACWPFGVVPTAAHATVAAQLCALTWRDPGAPAAVVTETGLHGALYWLLAASRLAGQDGEPQDVRVAGLIGGAQQYLRLASDPRTTVTAVEAARWAGRLADTLDSDGGVGGPALSRLLADVARWDAQEAADILPVPLQTDSQRRRAAGSGLPLATPWCGSDPTLDAAALADEQLRAQDACWVDGRDDDARTPLRAALLLQPFADSPEREVACEAALQVANYQLIAAARVADAPEPFHFSRLAVAGLAQRAGTVAAGVMAMDEGTARLEADVLIGGLLELRAEVGTIETAAELRALACEGGPDSARVLALRRAWDRAGRADDVPAELKSREQRQLTGLDGDLGLG